MRLFSASLALAVFLGSFAFADDANVLPQGVVRLRIVPAFSSTTQTYDKDGKKVDFTGDNTLTVLSGALEYGVAAPVTIGLKWAPGYYLNSKFSDANAKHLLIAGPDDLQIGAKVEVAGPAGFMANEMFRFALTPGISLPLDKYDAKTEATNYLAGKDFRLKSSSGHSSLGLGVKADFDYLINSMFYVNVHGEALQYLASEAISFNTYATNLGTYAGAKALGAPDAVAQAAADGAAPLTNTKVTYGLEYTAELEPHATFDLGNNSNIGLGLPVTMVITPENTSSYNKVDTKEPATSSTQIRPYASFFTLLGPVPVELQAEYDLTVAGKSVPNTSNLVIQAKVFYKF